ncbi:ABC transporter substrate-binding protein [Planomonospora sp. ID82291]|uniref:ABC transporter substrate-binding protein n=1 Tax=Planomonospora sp. ID82291 TaxID=2738136 RepID=UPI0018C3A63B|nr:sugar ABC transporter substrate-binding protein [Planomonospora sp. ID82291]MBG0818864.1 sugar ABC transporter substrate-binding protein [Planomonospora sp. ID82291]
MRKPAIAALFLAILTAALTGTAACSPAADPADPAGAGASGDAGRRATAADIEKALQTETTLTFWSWVPDIDKTVALFERKYPKVKINLVNAGQSAAHYTKLQSVVKAGSGAPDVAQLEYFALPQFALSKAVVDLNRYGAAETKDAFTPSAWEQVTVNGGVYGVPQDTGPMVMFYRTDVFDRLKLDPPKTWEEFRTVAEKIKADDPDAFVTSVDPSDAGGVDSLIWQAGGRPFAIQDATTVRVNLRDEGTGRWAALWGDLAKRKLVDPAVGWNDAWWRDMASGKYAVWIAGAWAPGAIASTIPQSTGKWRAAPMPQWDPAAPAAAENGGSAVSVLTQSRNPLAAVGFARWLNSDPEAVRSLNTASGLFPATRELLGSAEFTEAEIPVLGGQKANKVFAEASARVAPGWQYLPFQVYANSVMKDTLGRAVAAGTDLGAGLTAWQEQITAYARQQGFTLASGS